MAAYYGTKIKNGVINSKTGLPWTIDDVPAKKRAETQAWLDEHTA